MMTKPASIPVIIDTDPGLDDVIALLLALASPELDILGITTVGGNIGLELTTLNALRVLAVRGRTDIPVIAGAAQPLRRMAINAPGIHGEDGIGGIGLSDPTTAHLDIHAADWMARMIDDHPDHSIRLLTLGPLTNVAHLIERHPQAARKLAAVVSMGGAVRDRGNVTPHAEFNIAADPEAADLVVRSGIPVTLVPLDVTRQVSVSSLWGERLAKSGGKSGQITSQCINAYITNIERFYETLRAADRPVPDGEIRCPLHDPCVVLWALRPDLFTAESMPITIISDGSERDGATVIDNVSGHSVDVVVRARTEEVLAFVAARLTTDWND
jgi:purine nucleosidase/pyrimidine-specific ribonucleoside hydrolase